MKLIVSFYATANENPLGLPNDYPCQCTEVADDFAGEVPVGSQLMTLEEFEAYKSSRSAVYEDCLAVFEASVV